MHVFGDVSFISANVFQRSFGESLMAFIRLLP